ncbi:MAG TPA: redoxin domain-containing protein [Anaerolineales bacterium]|nr:redoxin domain-containing protein [Anaerolineales bacterium]
MHPQKRGLIRYIAGTLVLTGLAITVVVGLASGSTWFESATTSDEPIVGAQAPDFTLTSLAGEQINLKELRGKPVILNFWATWCAPCVIEMPNIQKYFELYQGEFEVIGVNADEPPKKVQEFIDDIGATFTILLDPGAVIQDLYRIRGYPTTFFLDARGIIKVLHIGLLSDSQIEEYLLKVDIGR